MSSVNDLTFSDAELNDASFINPSFKSESFYSTGAIVLAITPIAPSARAWLR